MMVQLAEQSGRSKGAQWSGCRGMLLQACVVREAIVRFRIIFYLCKQHH